MNFKRKKRLPKLWPNFSSLSTSTFVKDPPEWSFSSSMCFSSCFSKCRTCTKSRLENGHFLHSIWYKMATPKKTDSVASKVIPVCLNGQFPENKKRDLKQVNILPVLTARIISNLILFMLLYYDHVMKSIILISTATIFKVAVPSLNI